MRKSVILRADGSERTGLGHLYRMVALADMLAPEFSCYLAYRNGFPSVWKDNDSILSTYKLSCPEEREAAEVCKIAESLQQKNDPASVIVVLDGYQYDLNYQAQIKAEGFMLVFVDDIQHTDFVADLVVNHAPSARLVDYNLADYTRTAFGLRFALLRQVFLQPSASTPAVDSVTPVFLCLGGADPDNLSVRVLVQLETIHSERSVDLVIGSAYLHQASLLNFLASSKLEVRVHQGLSAKDMATLMWSSAFGITSPSTISLEYLATSKQLFLQQTADNQKDIQASLLKQKIAFPLSSLTVEPTYPLNPAVGRLYDGNQGVRFRKLLAGLSLKCRNARYDDCRLLYRWTTDPAVRSQSFSSGKIDWGTHKAWYITQLVREDRRFYVYEDADGPVGLVRFSIQEDVAMLGYSVDDRVRGKGYGLSMVHFAAERLRSEITAVRRIDAFVKKENMASRITLSRLGYTELPTADYPDALKFILNV